MSWPLASDFQTILQNPRIAFRDPYLRACSIERDPCGQPRAWAGSFAVVYKGIDAAGTPVAIRVFSTESPQRRGRYDQIGAYLADRRLACLVSFEYREDEIRSLRDGKRYPIVLMDWVEGETLFQWVRRQCRRCDTTAIMSAARQWPAVAAELSREQIAHGDLQHANVMVTPECELKLVDYDGMCVPALAGAECLEFGTPPYQHPRRGVQSQLSPRLDDFSALLIHVALHALAVDPGLWSKHVEQANYDKLLFREDDFRFSERSVLRRDLLASARPYVRDMTERLFAAAAGEIDAVPSLDEIIDRCLAPAASLWGADRTGRGAAVPAAVPAGETAAPQSGAVPATGSGTRPAVPRPAIAMPKLCGYTMLGELGRGPSGAVFLAKSESTGQQVAVKVMPIKTAATEMARRRFLAQIDRAAQARHPNIVGLIEHGMVGHAFYFVNEYCEGGNLAQWMESGGGKLRPVDVRAAMRQCLDALKHAHLHRLLHGNITPTNVLLSQATLERVVKLSDFGIAGEFLRRFGGPSVVTGTPLAAAFIPPERLTSEHGLSSRSDLWGLGSVFYYALTGRLPWDFGSEPPLKVVAAETPVPLCQRDGTIPPSVADVIDRSLRPNPAHRFFSAAEMKAAWDAAFDNVH